MKNETKVQKTIKVKTLIIASVYTILMIIIGATFGIVINNAINKAINDQVQLKTAEAVKVFTKELEK